jgi:hypothetical protein
MWSNRILVLGAAAVGAAAMMVGPTAASAGAEPCVPTADNPTPGCMPPNTVGAPEGAGDLPAMDPPVGAAASADVCGPAIAPTPCGVPGDVPPADTAAMAGSPPPNPCNDSAYFMANIAICMNPQIVGEAQPAG